LYPYSGWPTEKVYGGAGGKMLRGGVKEVANRVAESVREGKGSKNRVFLRGKPRVQLMGETGYVAPMGPVIGKNLF